MNTLTWTFGGMFLALAALFALGLAPRFAARFYPNSPNLPRRLAAPVAFALLSAACFAGWAMPSLSLVALLGTAQVVFQRRRRRKSAG